jgi:hypothetical protein
MKIIFSTLILLLALSSCQEDVKFNEPAFQGIKDNVFWQASSSKAKLNTDGTLTIEGSTATETVTLKTNSVNIKDYELGVTETRKASYEFRTAEGKMIYTTGIEIGNGTVTITEYDVAKHTISGSFRFNAVNAFFKTNLNFQKGVFYKVPVY